MYKENLMPVYYNALKNAFPDFSKDEMSFIITKINISTLNTKKMYLMAGEIQQNLIFVYQGLLRIFSINDKGEEITIAFARENSLAADYDSFIKQNPSKYYIETLEDSLLINIPFSLIQECYSKYKNFEKTSRLNAEAHLSKRQRRIESFLFNNAEQRYLNFVSENKDLLHRISITHLASFLGIKRQTLTRIRKALNL